MVSVHIGVAIDEFCSDSQGLHAVGSHPSSPVCDWRGAAQTVIKNHIGIFDEILVKLLKIAYNKNIILKICDMEEMVFMALAEAVKTNENSYTVESAMNVLLSKLDEALDDVEHGRVLDEDELWTEIDAI